jgi:hypothetical protein
MNTRSRAARMLLLACAVVVGLLAWSGLQARTGTTLNQVPGTARLTGTIDDPDPVLWNRYQLRIRYTSSTIVSAIIGFTKFGGPGYPIVFHFESQTPAASPTAAAGGCLYPGGAAVTRPPERRAPNVRQ